MRKCHFWHQNQVEHFQLSRVSLFSHCSFSQGCPFKVLAAFFHFPFFCFLLFSPPTFHSNFDTSGSLIACRVNPAPPRLGCTNTKHPDSLYQSEQVPSLHTMIIVFATTKLQVVWKIGTHISKFSAASSKSNRLLQVPFKNLPWNIKCKSTSIITIKGMNATNMDIFCHMKAGRKEWITFVSVKFMFWWKNESLLYPTGHCVATTVIAGVACSRLDSAFVLLPHRFSLSMQSEAEFTTTRGKWWGT